MPKSLQLSHPLPLQDSLSLEPLGHTRAMPTFQLPAVHSRRHRLHLYVPLTSLPPTISEFPNVHIIFWYSWNSLLSARRLLLLGNAPLVLSFEFPVPLFTPQKNELIKVWWLLNRRDLDVIATFMVGSVFCLVMFFTVFINQGKFYSLVTAVFFFFDSLSHLFAWLVLYCFCFSIVFLFVCLHWHGMVMCLTFLNLHMLPCLLPFCPLRYYWVFISSLSPRIKHHHKSVAQSLENNKNPPSRNERDIIKISIIQLFLVKKANELQ